MKIIITGAYVIGTHLAKLLSRDHEDITLIDEDIERLNKINTEFDLLTMQAMPNSIKALKEAGVSNADLFIAVTPDENLNMTSWLKRPWLRSMMRSTRSHSCMSFSRILG